MTWTVILAGALFGIILLLIGRVIHNNGKAEGRREAEQEMYSKISAAEAKAWKHGHDAGIWSVKRLVAELEPKPR
jgi:hypothetical protein